MNLVFHLYKRKIRSFKPVTLAVLAKKHRKSTNDMLSHLNDVVGEFLLNQNWFSNVNLSFLILKKGNFFLELINPYPSNHLKINN